jgi:hypothetical protein
MKQIILLFLACCVFGIKSSAQFSKNEQTNQFIPKASIGFGFNPSVNYRTFGIKSDFQYDIYEEFKEIQDSINQFLPTLNYSFDILLDLAPKFAIETGLQFHQKGYVFDNEEDPFDGYQSIRTSLLVSSVVVPLNMRFYLSRGIRPLFISVGASAGFVTRISDITQIKHDDYTQTLVTSVFDNDYKKLDLGLRLGFGYRTYIGESGIMTIEPYFLKSMSRIEESEYFNLRFYTIGLRLGFQVEL